VSAKFEHFHQLYIFGASSLAMTERGRVVTERALEAACNNLIDIEPNALSEGDRHQNASQDITKQPSSEKQDIPRLAEPPSSKGNKLYLHISV